ncbi:C2 domain-containing protein [Cryptococcus wingfieldii CBS 7118]|uniref:C2 domain-containing protein n=1 Tax=Cryptococcus wingfieldii CBS 7118 TaxID=1295528 RepID=A0A1E3IMA6_9TREE|nr:C2 domain-containing protein [Cryptococcus wingfieldii CBS 7118]ODN89729.1 C2 domain-containing protein [Cryptococcus wingfieldii CBS 7118]
MSDEKQPAGGYDPTPLHPSTSPTYTLRITFHRATNLPIADFGSGSSDPYILAQATTSQRKRHPQDPQLRFRTNTVRKSLEPVWDAPWVLAGVPEDGLNLSVRVYDEDPEDHDDRLGKFEFHTGPLTEKWEGVRERSFKVKKTGADVRAYALRWACVLLRDQELHADVIMSVEMLGKTKQEMGKTYTINGFWWKHYSPVIGRLTGIKAKDHEGVERYNFQANEIQLVGPVPNELYMRYVEFKPFVKGMFTASGLRGKVLNKALHHQHERLYNFDRQTEYGVFPDTEEGKNPGDDVTKKFLDLVHHDQGARIFTYVITLDSLFRFTETGKEFGIDLLSKHTMHADVDIYIAWSGEFFVRRVSDPSKPAFSPEQHTHPTEDLPNGPPNADPPADPANYELIIDNDSGTYRPNKDLIPVFEKFLKRVLPGIKVVVMACDDDKLQEMKSEQRKTKLKEGEHIVYGQTSSSNLADGDGGSISSSDEDDLDARARQMEEEDTSGGAATGHLDTVVGALESPKEAVKKLVPDKKEK